MQPQNPDALHLLGVIAQQTGHPDAAIDLITRALAQKDHDVYHANLGVAYRTLGEVEKATACFRTALAINPNQAEALTNLGIVLGGESPSDEAVSCFQKALEISPRSAIAHGNLGNLMKDQGRLDKALECYRQAIALSPDNSIFHSNLLLTLQFDPRCTALTQNAESRQWDQQHGVPRRQFVHPHTNSPDPDRRLRIGYVSPDMREHPVTRFLLPLLQNHDHSQFEVTCYADIARADTMTQRLRHGADHWRMTAGFFEEQLAAQIRADEIDILVDLALHTAANRLPVFARKPAPVQVTYLAYPGTSGLSAMDYRLTDPFLDPPGAGDEAYTETSVRLPSYWCYQAPEAAPPVAAPPALSADHITFGCLNNFAKVNDDVLRAWGRLMRAIPLSRLLLHTREGSHRAHIYSVMSEAGIAADRVSLLGHVPAPAYYSQYEQMDIALDTFPYAGGTTTCDALWMGVPVVTLVGQTAVGRGGLSILSNIGLTRTRRL